MKQFNYSGYAIDYLRPIIKSHIKDINSSTDLISDIDTYLRDDLEIHFKMAESLPEKQAKNRIESNIKLASLCCYDSFVDYEKTMKDQKYKDIETWIFYTLLYICIEYILCNELDIYFYPTNYGITDLFMKDLERR